MKTVKYKNKNYTVEEIDLLNHCVWIKTQRGFIALSLFMV